MTGKGNNSDYANIIFLNFMKFMEPLQQVNIFSTP